MKPTTAKNLLLAGAALLIPASATGQDPNLIVPQYAWFGSANGGQFNGVLAVGKNNLLAIGTSFDTGSAVIGTGMRTDIPNSVAVGQYNNHSLTGSPPRFMVGNGTGASAGTRSTIMDVRQDGTVTLKKVPAKGGISMGIFTAPAVTTPPSA